MVAPLGPAADRPAVALVGCGRWGRLILRDLRSLGCEVPVVARSAESKERARAGGASVIVERVEDLPLVDGVVVATSTSTHAEILDAALDRDVPVFVEKPLCDSPVEARRLAARFPHRLFVMDKWRYHPGVRAMADVVRSGDLGAPVGIAARRVTWGNPHPDVGPLWTYLPHDLAIVLEVLGSLPPLRAVAPEVVSGELVGAFVLLGQAPWASLEVSISAPESRRELRVLCEHGALVLDGGYAEALLVSRSGPPSGEPERLPIDGEMPLLAELRAFVEHLRGGPAPASSAAEGAQIVELVAEVHRLAGLSQEGLVTCS